MKHLKKYKIYESIEYLPKGTKGKPIYPMDKVEDFIEKFSKYYQKSMNKQGWDFFICDYDSILKNWDVSKCGNFVYRVEKSDFFDSETELVNDEEASTLAEKYGIVLDNNGVVYDYDDKVFQDHVLAGLDLGLLEANRPKYDKNNKLIKRPKYDFKKISELVIWFDSQLGDWSLKQGWGIFLTDLPSCVDDWNTDEVYRVEPVDTDSEIIDEENELSYEEAEERAKQIGFILDDMGVVYDWDEDLFNKNKHLITGIDLGLI